MNKMSYKAEEAEEGILSEDIFFNNTRYIIEYSLETGEIKDFIKILNKERVKVTNEKEKMQVIEQIIESYAKDPLPGYSLFLYKLADEGKIKLPEKKRKIIELKWGKIELKEIKLISKKKGYLRDEIILVITPNIAEDIFLVYSELAYETPLYFKKDREFYKAISDRFKGIFYDWERKYEMENEWEII